MQKMTGIEIRTEHDRIHATLCGDEHSYVVQIDGEWYRIEYKQSNIHTGKRVKGKGDEEAKLEVYGQRHQFHIFRYQNPEEKLPEAVEQFLKKHLQDGCAEGHLITLEEGMTPLEDKGFKPGWVGE